MEHNVLISKISSILENPCPNEHQIQRKDLHGGTRFSMRCGDVDATLSNLYVSLNDSKNTIDTWVKTTLLQHRIDMAPKAIVEWLMTSEEVDDLPFTDSLHGDLRHVFNKHSVENGADIPDSMLATYTIESIKALNTVVRRRDKFFSFEPFPKTMEAINKLHNEIQKSDG